MTTMGQGKEMRRVPCTHRDSKTMCRPSGPCGTFWVQAGSGCLAAMVTRSRGGSVWASPKSSRDSMGTATSRATCPGAGLAAGACRTSRSPRPLTAGLARGPSTTGASGPVATGASGPVAVLLGQSGPGLVLAPGVVPNVRRPREERHL